MVTLLALSAGLMITLAGIPLLVATLLVARGIGVVERSGLGPALGVASARHRGTNSAGSVDRLRDPADWRAVLYAILVCSRSDWSRGP